MSSISEALALRQPPSLSPVELPPRPASPSPPALLAPDSQAEPLQQRRSIYATAVVDSSPSMGSEKLTALQQSLEAVVMEVRAGLALGDRLAMVTFDDEACTKSDLRAMNQRAVQRTLRYIKRMETNGHSNVSAGLMAGLRVLSASFDAMPRGDNDLPEPPPVRALLLFTDFHSNRGITEGTTLLAEVRRLVEEERKHHHVPIQIFTFGFGTMHDSVQLMSMADAFGGKYYSLGGQIVLARESLMIEPPPDDQIKEAVADCFAHLKATAARPAALHRMAASRNLLPPPSSTHSADCAGLPCAPSQRLRPSTSERVLARQHSRVSTFRRQQQQQQQQLYAAPRRSSSASAFPDNQLPAVGAAAPPPRPDSRESTRESTAAILQQTTARARKTPTTYLLPRVSCEPQAAANSSWTDSSQPWRSRHDGDCPRTYPSSSTHSSMVLEDA